MCSAGKVSMEEFIAQLSDEDLATIVRGEGMSNPLVTPGTASAFGGMSERLRKYGMPIGCTADGPSGIRMDSGHKATQVPIGTLLAATWDPELVEELYVLEGKELVRNQSTAARSWHEPAPQSAERPELRIFLGRSARSPACSARPARGASARAARTRR